LVLHADTYNAVLRQHHYRQKQLSSATALLSELPLFKGHNYSKIASIAYTMRSQSYSSGTILAKHGEIINNVLLIASGQVKVYAPPAQGNTHTDEKDKNTPTKRLPRLAVCLLGRGQIVGEIEISKNSRTFQMTYETCSATTEILEMPATTFKDSISTEEIKQSMIYKSIEDINEEKEQRRVGRLTRAYDAVKKMMEGNSSEKKAKDELMSILPAIIDPAVNDSPNISAKNTSFRGGNEFSSPSKPTRRLSNIPINLLEGGVGTDSVAVTRKASFAVKNLEDLEKVYDSSFSAKFAGQTLSTKNTKSAMPTDTTLGPPSSTKKSSIMNSPRKLTFAPK
jgi:CRP-like cAMP-binding protein